MKKQKRAQKISLVSEKPNLFPEYRKRTKEKRYEIERVRSEMKRGKNGDYLSCEQ